jgi:hypothetical protein
VIESFFRHRAQRKPPFTRRLYCRPVRYGHVSRGSQDIMQGVSAYHRPWTHTTPPHDTGTAASSLSLRARAPRTRVSPCRQFQRVEMIFLDAPVEPSLSEHGY